MSVLASQQLADRRSYRDIVLLKEIVFSSKQSLLMCSANNTRNLRAKRARISRPAALYSSPRITRVRHVSSLVLLFARSVSYCMLQAAKT